MAALIDFEVKGVTKTIKGLAAIQAGMKDLRPFWKEEFAPKYFAIAQDLFSTMGRARGGRGRFKGGAWAWLTPKYRAWKDVNYPGKGILIREGDLKESVRWSGNSVGHGGIFEPHPKHVLVGTAIPYGKFHQYGTKHMKPREFLPSPDPKIFAPLMKQWLLKLKKK